MKCSLKLLNKMLMQLKKTVDVECFILEAGIKDKALSNLIRLDNLISFTLQNNQTN